MAKKFDKYGEIVLAVLILAVALYIINPFGIFAATTTSEAGTFYQTYPQVNTASTCYASQTLIDKLYSQEATIKTDSSTFRIVITKNPFHPERSPGNTCAHILADYQIYKDGQLIDTITSDDWVADIHAADYCAVPNPTIMKRAYSDDGSISGEVESLPEGVNGIEVNFGASGWSDGLSLTKGCRAYHVDNYFRYKYGSFDMELISTPGENVKYKIISEGNYHVLIENKLTKSGEVPQTFEKELNLVEGENIVELEIVQQEDMNLQTDLTIYKITSDFSGLNADSNLFYPLKSKVRFQDNSYFKLGEESLRTISLGEQEDCSAGEIKCEGTIYYTCSDGNWDSQGQVEGHCGYTSGSGDVDECSSEDTKCAGTTYFTCSNGDWDSQGLVDGKCGYVVDSGDNGNSSIDWNKEIIKLGDFEVTLLMVVLVVGVLLLIILFKK